MTRLAALALLVGVLLGLAPPVAAQEPGGATVALVSQTPWLDEGGSFDLLLDVDRPPDDARLVVTVHRQVRSRSEFAQSLEGRVRGTSKTVRLDLADAPREPDGSIRLALPLPATGVAGTPLTLPALRAGVYAVSVALRDDEDELLDRFVTHLVRLPAESDDLTPLAVAWVQPVGAAPAIRPDGERALPDDDRAALGTVLGALDPGLQVTIDATPETLEVLEPADLESLRQAVEGGAQLLSAPYVDVDPSALVAGDLAVQRQVGEDVLLEAVGTRGDPRIWSVDRRLTAGGLQRLRALGVTRVVVPESTLEPLDPDVAGSTTLTRPFALAAGTQAVSIDPGLAAHFQGGDDQVLAAHQLLADLAVLFFDLPGIARGVAIRPPERWRPSSAFLGTVLPALADVRIVDPVTLERLFDEVEPLVDDDDAPVVRDLASGGRSAGLPTGRIDAARRSVDETLALAGPGEVVDGMRTRLLAAQSSRLDAPGRAALLDGITARAGEVAGGVRLPVDRRTFRLTARQGTIPLTLDNDNPFPVDVELVLSSDKLEFTGGRSRLVLRIRLEPGTHTETVPVRARASSKFAMQIAVAAPGGAPIRQAQVTIISTAFSGVGVVLSIGAGFFLLLWWASHWRTVRRDRRLVEAPK